MDKLSLAGLALAVVAILGGQLLEGGNLGSLVQLAAFLIVIGGTLAAVMVQSPMSVFLEGVRLAKWVVVPPAFDADRIIAQVGQWASEARRDGMLALENQLPGVDDPYTRNGLQMLVDGFEPERIREALEVETVAWEERHRAAAKVWEAAGGYAPTVGILGAVLGLIHVMENLSDPNKLGGGIAVAFVATVYGVGSANLLFLPIAQKLKTLIARQVRRREIVADGLLGIANGENPKVIEGRLEGYLGKV
ncbi:MAG TPA: flagellar motor protein [Casimicrobiaceae bacterium]|nr:flagellar motor protein [Casimicrobiaceae bacterium]